MKTGAGCLGGSRRRGGWGISPRRRARALSAQTRGPYTVRPWSCCWAQHPCWSQAAGERYPTHLADASTHAESAGHEEWLSQTALVNAAVAPFGISSRASVTLSIAKSRLTRPRKSQRQRTKKFGMDEELRRGSRQRSLRRRMVGHISIRQLGSNRDVGPSSSSRDGRNTVHASAWTRPVRGAGGRYDPPASANHRRPLQHAY
jgi:hypothetical protein